MTRAWDPAKLPDQTGRTFLVTGGNAGLGYFACEQLARSGAHVILSGRNPNRIAAAKDAIEARVADASIETLLLDVSNLGSVRAAAASVRGGFFRRQRLDGLLLNAGIVHTPRQREVTRDGRELVIATNALGHFALAAELLTTLSRAASRENTPRLVWLGSVSTKMWNYDPVDIQMEKNYKPWQAYVQSKVVTQALGFEADARLRDAGVPVHSVVAHPGFSISGRTEAVGGVNEPPRRKRVLSGLLGPLAQSKADGAAPLVRALIDPDVRGGEYWGPARTFTGAAVRQRPADMTMDLGIRARIWEDCEQLTGVEWPFQKAARSVR